MTAELAVKAVGNACLNVPNPEEVYVHKYSNLKIHHVTLIFKEVNKNLILNFANQGLEEGSYLKSLENFTGNSLYKLQVKTLSRVYFKFHIRVSFYLFCLA